MARFHRAYADEHHQIRYMCFLKDVVNMYKRRSMKKLVD
jgi:hypothetical protein